MIYLNGRLVPRGEACIDPADRGFLLGDGLFETLRSRAGQPVRLDAHLSRLAEGAATLGIPLPVDRAEIRSGVLETLAANGLDSGAAALRITLTRGSGPRGLLPPREPRPTLLITAREPPPADTEPRSAIIATPRRNEHSPTARLKTLNYLDNVLARREAAERGADEALLINTAGRLASASAANLFLVRGLTLMTPPATEGVLPGITRAAVLGVAAEMGLSAVETPLAREDLWRAEEAFLTNSLIELQPLVRVEGRRVGDGRMGPLSRRLREALSSRLE